MDNINVARQNCAMAIATYYTNFGLLADMLGSRGEYRSYWQTETEKIIECMSDNIFNGNKGISMYEMFRCEWTRGLSIKS